MKAVTWSKVDVALITFAQICKLAGPRESIMRVAAALYGTGALFVF